MKKLIFIAMVALLCVSCADANLTPEQKKRKQCVMNFLEERVGKCDEVIIKYAKLDFAMADDIYYEEKSKHRSKDVEYPKYWATSELVRVIYRKDKDSYDVRTLNLQYFDNTPPAIFMAAPDQLYIYRSDKVEWTTIPVKVNKIK